MTKSKPTKHILPKHPFFEGLPAKYVRLLNEWGKSVKLKENEYLFHTEGKADKFYLILKGQISLEIFVPRQGQKVIQVLGDKEVVGWSWLFPPYRWHFDARVIKPSTAIILDGAHIRKECERDHELGYFLMKRFAYISIQRLQVTRAQFLELNESIPLPIEPWWVKPGIP